MTPALRYYGICGAWSRLIIQRQSILLAAWTILHTLKRLDDLPRR